MARKDLDEWLWQVGAELQRISEEITPAKPNFAKSAFWEPRVDIIESESEIILIAEIAGVSLGDVRVVYDGESHRLILRGLRRQMPLLEGQGGVHQLEISYGEFEKAVSLPGSAIRPDGARSEYRDGFLILLMPKVEDKINSNMERRRITIRHA